ncbi:hypothetical protein [Rhodohalobacter sp.]|uniref:hypothetical protein n=1 Tax=Rhodohalobacter sp. TaxID=1974210 RepID=UPI002ACDC33B|nr:hypothetical protein [Rhodohalobacter sp.]MDZ7754803.1 hypothetical protein [Rhodohalobacter sp.]
MKTTIKLSVLTIVFLFLFTGCFLQSVHPLVKPENSQFVEGVIGTWEDEDQRWIFARPESVPETLNQIEGFEDINEEISDEEKQELEYGYLVVHEDKEDNAISAFIGHFIELNEQLYFDLFPLNTWATGLLENHYFPVHTFSKIELQNGEMNIRLFKSSWIKEQIEDNRVRIKHEKIEDGVLITASTNELQRFVERYGETEEAFEDPISLQKTD